MVLKGVSLRVMSWSLALCLLATSTWASPDLIRKLGEASAAGDVPALTSLADDIMATNAASLELPLELFEDLKSDLAEKLSAEGNQDKAAELLESVLRDQEERVGPNAFELVDTLDKLAAVERLRGNTERANALEFRAFENSRRSLGDGHPTLKPRLEALADHYRQPPHGVVEESGEIPEERAEVEEALGEFETDKEDDTLVTLGGGSEPRARDTTHEVVTVYYGTHRKRTGSNNINSFYGAARSRTMEYGTVTVSVPTRGELGTIRRPGIWRQVVRIDPDVTKHVFLEKIDVATTRARFLRSLRRDIADSELKEMFVFVHGFNVTFRGAVERTAKLAVDLELDGAPVLYSWPSNGSLLGYISDGEELTAPLKKQLKDFLFDLAIRSGAERVHIIAHSMGNRYLMDALEAISAPDPNREPIFDEIIYASPDLDAEDFAARAPGVAHLADRSTLYASGVDKALFVSGLLSNYARAGNIKPPLVAKPLETVDTTKSTGGLRIMDLGDGGHNDFAGTALQDFRSIIWLSLDPQKRCILSEQPQPDGVVWVFGTARCDAKAYERAVVYARRKKYDFDAAIADLNEAIATLRSSGDDQGAADLEKVKAIVATF